jgi:hypothetical protein
LVSPRLANDLADRLIFPVQILDFVVVAGSARLNAWCGGVTGNECEAVSRESLA